MSVSAAIAFAVLKSVSLTIVLIKEIIPRIIFKAICLSLVNIKLFVVTVVIVIRSPIVSLEFFRCCYTDVRSNLKLISETVTISIRFQIRCLECILCWYKDVATFSSSLAESFACMGGASSLLESPRSAAMAAATPPTTYGSGWVKIDDIQKAMRKCKEPFDQLCGKVSQHSTADRPRAPNF